MSLIDHLGSAALALGLALATSSALAQPAASGDMIAFVSIRSGDAHIYVHSAGQDRQITQGQGVHTHPSLSADGRLAFVKSIGGLGKLFVTDAGGGNARRLTQAERIETSPTWSPDGRHLAFYSSDAAKPGGELHIVEVASGHTTVVGADGRDKGPTAASWSADGSRLAFLSANARGRVQVFAVGRDGSGLVDLSSKFNDRNKAGAQISPDGTRVVFTADARQRRPLVVAEVATGNLSELTPEPDAAFEVARWSPDGRQFAVVRIAEPGAPDSRNDIFVMDAQGGPLRNVSRHPGDDFDPHWAPDGRSIVFASLRTGTSMIYRVDLINGQTQAVSRGHRSHDMDHVVRAAPQ
jgi:Tol biopolymer transport system component